MPHGRQRVLHPLSRADQPWPCCDTQTRRTDRGCTALPL